MSRLSERFTRGRAFTFLRIYRFASGGILLLCLLFPPTVTHAGYTFVTIDDPSANGYTRPEGINDNGQISGDYADAAGIFHGFIDNNGAFSAINYPGAVNTVTNGGINNTNLLVGSYSNGGGLNAYVDSNGVFTSLNVPSASTSGASGINDQGQIVGWGINGSYFAFVLNGNVYTTFRVPGSISTVAADINNSGQIVGWFSNPSDNGFLLSNGVYTTIDYPGAVYSDAYGINNKGQVVGTYVDSNGQTHGFLWSGGVFTTIDDPSANGYTRPMGINDNGQIVGYYLDAAGLTDGFEADPSATPIPGAIWLFGSGIVGLIGLKKKYLG